LNVLVGAIADDKGNTPVGLGRMGGKRHANQGKKYGEVAHLKSPRWNRATMGATYRNRLHEKATHRVENQAIVWIGLPPSPFDHSSRQVGGFE
jgi:hypothetical protein